MVLSNESSVDKVIRWRSVAGSSWLKWKTGTGACALAGVALGAGSVLAVLLSFFYHAVVAGSSWLKYSWGWLFWTSCNEVVAESSWLKFSWGWLF